MTINGPNSVINNTEWGINFFFGHDRLNYFVGTDYQSGRFNDIANQIKKKIIKPMQQSASNIVAEYVAISFSFTFGLPDGRGFGLRYGKYRSISSFFSKMLTGFIVLWQTIEID